MADPFPWTTKVLTSNGFKPSTSEEIALAALDDVLNDLRLARLRLERAGWNCTNIERDTSNLSNQILNLVVYIESLKTKVRA